MNTSSLILTPSSALMLTDIVPFEAALHRLLYEKVHSDEQLSSYGVHQAYRGLLYAVRADTLALKGVGMTMFMSSPPSLVSPSVLGTSAASLSQLDSSINPALARGSPTAGNDDGYTFAVRGWQAVLYRLALAAVRSADDLECAVFFSVRILCDPASAHGQGNERPCCTAEWTHALLHGLPLDDFSVSRPASYDSPDARFAHLAQTNRRYQLGYLLLLSNTLRMVATGRVGGQHLCSDYTELFHGVASKVLPRIAQYVEVTLRDTAETTPADLCSSTGCQGSSGAQAPSRLSVELNHLILHGGHWLAVDALSAHMNADSEEQQGKMKTKKRPLVLDRDQPACLWECVTLVRNALRRTLTWMCEEVRRQILAQAPSEGDKDCISATSVALLKEVSRQLDGTVTDLLKKHEYLQNALLNASRAYNGVATHDVRSLTDMTWSHTLQMCFLLRNLTGIWVSVHGGLGYNVLCADQLLPGSRDVLMFMASTLLRIPVLEAKREGDRETFLAVDASLGALFALVAAAPAAALQTKLWASDSAVTQKVHALLVQRALRYHDARVLKLASLLSRAVLGAAVRNGALAGFVTDSTDQLLELLESEDDAASRCVGELLSVAILQHPYGVVPALFRLLQHGSAATRRNVLEVLSSLPDLVSEAAASSSLFSSPQDVQMYDDDFNGADTHDITSGGLIASNETASLHNREEDRRRNVLRLLAENLLLQLQDEELCVRMLSSSLFAKVHPYDAVQPLLNLCVQRDMTGRKQSAAVVALTSVLAAHTGNAATFLLLLHSAYQRHCDAAESLSKRAIVPVGGDQQQQGSTTCSVDETEMQSVTFPAWRPVPQTPGDILSQALLYSTADPASGLAESGTNVDDEGRKDSADGRKEMPKTNAERCGEAHLNSALLHLINKWVAASLPVWTYERHSLPLVRCLAQQAVGHVLSKAGLSLEADAEAKTEDRVQFYMKYTLRVTSVLTGSTTGISSRATATSSNLACVRARHLLAIWWVFFADHAEDQRAKNGKANWETWRTAVECDKEVLCRASKESAQPRARVHAVLLPLLCLRSCAPGTFSRTRLLDILVHSSALASSEVVGNAINVAEIAQMLQENNSAVAEEACDKLASAIWRTLWHAVTHSTTPTAFFTLYPDVQRVVLEVLCRFPAALFFAQWQQWKDAVLGEEGNNAKCNWSDGVITSPPAVKITADTLFVYRVYVYGVSAYLAASLTGESVTQSTKHDVAWRASDSTNVAVVLQHRYTLVYVLTTVVPQWLMEDSSTCSSGIDNATMETEIEGVKRRLCMAAVDAGGVLGVVGLAFLQTPTDSDTPHVEATLLNEVLTSTCEELLAVPLTNLTLAYRATEGEEVPSMEVKSCNTEGEAHKAPAEPEWTELLTRFQLCLRTHASLLRAIVTLPRGARGLLLLWFRHYLHSFIEVSNAACKNVVGRSAHVCRAAVDACGVVFQAVLMARKMDDGTNGTTAYSSNLSAAAAQSGARPGTGGGVTSAAPTLCRLAWEEKDALVSFSVGCTRFAASPAVQTMGVRLLSSLLVAAPEIFLEVSTPQGGKAMAATASVSAAGSGGDALQAAAMALQSIALMHTDRSTRVLSEEVLRMLEKAYTSSEGAS